MIKIIISTFIYVFFAELGDKTQLQTMLLAAKTGKLFPVFLGSSLALVTASLIGVFAGSALLKLFPEIYLQYAAGAMFVALGMLTLLGII